MFRPLPSFFQQYDKWLMCFYSCIQWAGFAFAVAYHWEESWGSWRQFCHKHWPQVQDAAVACGDFEMFTLDKCVFQASKMAWKDIARCRGEQTARESIAFSQWNRHFQSGGTSPAWEEFGVRVSWTQWGVAGLCIRGLWSKQVAEPRTCC